MVSGRPFCKAPVHEAPQPFGPGQLLTRTNVCLGQFHRSRLIDKGKAEAQQILIAAFISKGKLLLLPCIDISVRGKEFLQVVFPVDRQIRDKEDLSVGIRGFLLDQGILLDQNPFQPVL